MNFSPIRFHLFKVLLKTQMPLYMESLIFHTKLFSSYDFLHMIFLEYLLSLGKKNENRRKTVTQGGCQANCLLYTFYPG